MHARSFVRVVPLALLLIAAFGCGQATAPTAPARTATHAGSTPTVTGSPSPGSGVPETETSPTPSPSPTATITNPRLNHLLTPILSPTFTFRWAPNVPLPSGPTPTRYRYRAFDEHGTDFEFFTILVDPQALIRAYAPDFAGWAEVSGSVTEATLQDMDPSQAHVLVLVAMDDHGHFDNTLSFDRNIAYFHVAPALVTDADRGAR